MILDLHVHSSYSFDSLARPRDILRRAKQIGLDGIAITDHDTVQGALMAAESNDDSDFLVIIGAEISTDAGDIIGLFLNDDITCRGGLAVIEEIHKQGGLVVLPHPYKGHKLSHELISMVDAIEVFNSRTGREQNDKAMALAKQYDKPMVVGSDAHFLSEIGLSKVIVESECVRAEILNGRAKLLEGRSAPPYKQSMSQVIKAAKQGRYHRIPWHLTGLVAKAIGVRRG